jgi:Mn-containing catalase
LTEESPFIPAERNRHLPARKQAADRVPAPSKTRPESGRRLQELLGGKYGEKSTLGNYLFQNFNFRSKSKRRPFYSLVAAITAEELGHVELVSNGVAMLNNGPDSEADDTPAPVISGTPYIASFRRASDHGPLAE